MDTCVYVQPGTLKNPTPHKKEVAKTLGVQKGELPSTKPRHSGRPFSPKEAGWLQPRAPRSTAQCWAPTRCTWPWPGTPAWWWAKWTSARASDRILRRCGASGCGGTPNEPREPGGTGGTGLWIPKMAGSLEWFDHAKVPQQDARAGLVAELVPPSILVFFLLPLGDVFYLKDNDVEF